MRTIDDRSRSSPTSTAMRYQRAGEELEGTGIMSARPPGSRARVAFRCSGMQTPSRRAAASKPPGEPKRGIIGTVRVSQLACCYRDAEASGQQGRGERRGSCVRFKAMRFDYAVSG